ncbi:extracellular solute-binding protein [Neobacillus sp. NPDC093127]|uniref:extracellular solute-binding protein n=1 Tax=Neobacillus sp. NPDC093127 TaxID=3364296 RepID=UPI0037F6BC6B
MKKGLGKVFVVILALLTVLAGCTSDKTNGDKNADGKTIVTAFSAIRPSITDFNDNELTRKIEKKLDIDIKFQTTPDDGARQKQSLLLASGDYPAAFIGGDFSGIEQLKYGKQGVFIPLNDLIDKYGPNIKAAFKQQPWIEKAITMPDGKIYGLPGMMGCYHCTYPIKMWINKDWLKNLNLEMPQTPEELEKVLTAFKNNDPNGNGKKDEVPLSGIPNDQEMNPINFIMNAFIYTNHGNYIKVNDGKLSFVANQPEWKQGLEYMRNLYSKGLFDPQTFTQQDEGVKQLANKGDKPLLGTFAGLWSGAVLNIEGDSDRWTKYEAIPPLKGPSGIQETVYNGNSASSAKFVITDKATKEQQIAAIKIADYVYSQEGALDEMFGIKGTGWFEPKEGDLGVDGKPAIFRRGELDPEKPSNILWDNDFTYLTEDLYHGQAASQDINILDGYERYLYLQTKEKYDGHRPAETLLNDVVDPEKAQRIAEIKADLLSFVQGSAVQFIIGEKNLEKDWDAYVKAFNKLGVDEYLAAYQETYDAIDK